MYTGTKENVINPLAAVGHSLWLLTQTKKRIEQILQVSHDGNNFHDLADRFFNIFVVGKVEWRDILHCLACFQSAFILQL